MPSRFVHTRRRGLSHGGKAMLLYQCLECDYQYVVGPGGFIQCPHCDSKMCEDQGEFTLEDINELLSERKEAGTAVPE